MTDLGSNLVLVITKTHAVIIASSPSVMLNTGPARPPPPSILAASGVDDAPKGNVWLLFDVGGALLPLGCTLRYTCSSHRNSTIALKLEHDLLSPLTFSQR